MFTFRHNDDLFLAFSNKTVIAPRKFIIKDNVYYVHIADGYCQYVQIYDRLRYANNCCAYVAISNFLKLHSNSKGLYFNYSYWVSEEKKKTIRVYICE